jgi:hypothetical protein
MAQRRNEIIPANVIAASALTNDDFDRALEGFARFPAEGSATRHFSQVAS